MVVVEGYTDVLALHQAGVHETVAIMGTALTPEQLAELARAARTVFLALDADASGQEAMLRAARAAADRGLELRVVALPGGTDPAEIVLGDGAGALRALLETAQSVPEFQVGRVLDSADVGSLVGRDRALDELLPFLAATPAASVSREELVRRVADRLDVPLELVAERMRRPPRAPSGGAGALAAARRAAGGERPAPQPSLDPAARSERTFLAMCLGLGALGRAYLDRLEPEHLSHEPLRKAAEHLREHFEDPLGAVPEDPALGPVLTELAMLAGTHPASEHVLRLSFLQLDLRRIERELRRASGGRSFERERELWPVREGVRREIDQLMRSDG
jgi:DNA primase